jgi:hypothetical protein
VAEKLVEEADLVAVGVGSIVGGRGLLAVNPVQLMHDQHVVVEAVHRRVQGDGVEADLDAGEVAELVAEQA